MTRSLFQYPTGMVGLALALLRLSLAAALVGGGMLTTPAGVGFGAFVVAIALALGIFTRFAAVLGIGAAALIGFNTGGTLGLSAALHGVAMLALSMLGAGGYSVDALLFGRRVILLDP